MDGWDAVPDEALRTRYLKPAYLAFEHTIQQAIHWSQRATEQQTRVIEKVAFFFDSFEREAAHCYDVAKVYENGPINSHWFEGIAFAKMSDTLPLQAADMLAYETYRLETARVKSAQEPSLRPVLKAMIADEMPIYGQYYDEEALRNLAKIISNTPPVSLLFPQNGA